MLGYRARSVLKREHYLKALEHESYKSDEVLAQKAEEKEGARKADTVFKASNGLDNFSCFPLSFSLSFSPLLTLFLSHPPPHFFVCDAIVC